MYNKQVNKDMYATQDHDQRVQCSPKTSQKSHPFTRIIFFKQCEGVGVRNLHLQGSKSPYYEVL